MAIKLLNYCPKCSSMDLAVELEAGQYNLYCHSCQLYCEIIIFDEGNPQ